MKYLPFSVLFFAATLLAQGPKPAIQAPRGAAALTELQSYLTLSDSQVSQLKDLQQQYMDAIAPVASQAAEKRKSLVGLVKAGNGDPATMTQLRQDLTGLHTQAQGIAKQYGDNARALLSADQQTKLQALEEALKLMPAVHGAQALNLIEGQRPFGGFGRMGPGMMGRRAPR